MKNYGITLIRGNYATSGWQMCFWSKMASIWMVCLIKSWKRLVFQPVQYSNVQYSSPHCIDMEVVGIVGVMVLRFLLFYRQWVEWRLEFRYFAQKSSESRTTWIIQKLNFYEFVLWMVTWLRRCLKCQNYAHYAPDMFNLCILV